MTIKVLSQAAGIRIRTSEVCHKATSAHSATGRYCLLRDLVKLWVWRETETEVMKRHWLRIYTGAPIEKCPQQTYTGFQALGVAFERQGRSMKKKGISTQRDKVAKGIVRNSCHLVRHLRRKRPQISFNKYKARRVTLNRRRQLNNKHVTAKPKDQNEKKRTGAERREMQLSTIDH